MANLFIPQIIELDITHVDESFEVCCPVCGKEATFYESPSCPHLLIFYVPRTYFHFSKLLTGRNISPVKCFQAIVNILSEGSEQPLVIFKMTFYTNRIGLENAVNFIGFSLASWSDCGAEFQ